jgi:hypothetical protein
VSDPTFNSVKIRQDTIGAVGDLLTIDTVGAGAGNGAALSFINNSAVEGLHFVLGRISIQRVDATTVRMDLAVANDPTISSGDDTPPALSLLQSAGGLSVATAASSTLAVGGALSVSGASSMSGTLDVNGAAVLGGTLNVGGAAMLAGALSVGGAIIPAAGNADTAGIRFPNDPGDADDQAWIRYYAQAGAATTLEIGVSNDADDHIALMPTGNVGIGTVTPGFKLDVTDRMRVREGPSGTAGIWLHQLTPNTDQAFVGMASDTSVGLWGNTGAGWGLVMDTSSGNVGIKATPFTALTIAGSIGFTNSVTPLMYIFQSGTTNPERPVIAHSPPFPNWGLSYRDPDDTMIFQGGGTPVLSMQLGSNRVGVGTSAPTHRFHVVAQDAVGLFESTGSQAYLRLSTAEGLLNRVEITNRPGGRLSLWTAGAGDIFNITRGGNVGIGTTSPTHRFVVIGSAAKPGGGAWTTTSDQRLKRNIAPLECALDRLLQLRGVSYEWIDPARQGGLDGIQIGMVAQEVEQVFPEWVGCDANGYKDLTFRGFEALTVEAIRELAAENALLRTCQVTLENRVNDLERQIATYV